MIWKSTRVLFVVFTGKSYKMSHILWVMQWKFCIKCTNSVLYISKSWNIDKTAVPNRSIRAYWLSKRWYLWHTKTSMVSRFQLGSSQKSSFSFGLSKSFSSEQRVTVMLVTSFRWWLYDGDWFDMLVAESFNMSNLSPTHLVSNIRHQHRCNRTKSFQNFNTQKLICSNLISVAPIIPDIKTSFDTSNFEPITTLDEDSIPEETSNWDQFFWHFKNKWDFS